MTSILVVSAHPDDETFGMAGTIARHAAAGDEVHVLFLADGVTSRWSANPSRDVLSTDDEVVTRKAEAEAACNLLSCQSLAFCDLPDQRLDTLPILEVTKLIEDMIVQCQPEIVYTHWGGDLNRDHQIAAEATLTACRPLPGRGVRRVLAYPVPSSTGWGMMGCYEPTYFVDISAFLGVKLAAMVDCYKSEARDWPHPCSQRAVMAWARMWGSQVGLDAAEAFVVVREVV